MWLWCLGVLFLGSLGASAEAADLEGIKARVDQAVENEGFSGGILISVGDEVLFERYVGPARLPEGTLLGPDTQWPVASITKSFTAMLIFQLVEDGKLRLDETIADVLPDLAVQRPGEVTVRQLLNHTSGLPTERGLAYRKAQSPVDLVNAYGKSRRRRGTVGEFRYNNLDYWILGLIIEARSGRTYESLLSERILQPAGMEASGLYGGEPAPEAMTQGFVQQRGETRIAPNYHLENFWAAGALYSTPRDLMKWDRALVAGGLLGKEGLELFYEEGEPALGYVGLSHWVFPYPFVEGNPIIVERRGGLPGFNHTILRMVESEGVIVILSNNDQFDPDTFGNLDSLKESLIVSYFSEPGADPQN